MLYLRAFSHKCLYRELRAFKSQLCPVLLQVKCHQLLKVKIAQKVRQRRKCSEHENSLEPQWGLGRTLKKVEEKMQSEVLYKTN